VKLFDFSKTVVNQVIAELGYAESFVRIAIFQLHNRGVFAALNEKLGQGVRVEIFTLPYDSINPEIRDEVTAQFQFLEKNGAKLYFCKWNVGDPERTSTAVGRWYSFHGKFIVTDKSAIALSANFTQSPEIDGLLIYRDEPEKINEFNEKLDELMELFIKNDDGYDGSIRQKVISTGLPNVTSVFTLPRSIETGTHREHWIAHYPASLCPVRVPIEDRLYVTPFDCRGRDFVMAIISAASEFAYVSTESFTDPDFPTFLTKRKLQGLDVRILSGATSMDFSNRMQDMLRELIAQDIQIRTTDEDLHAKLIITDKHFVISSVNLNRMNLGFKRTANYWRENTETITVCTDAAILSQSKVQFLDIFDRSINIETKLTEKVEKLVGAMLSSMFGLRSDREVKQLFAHVIVKKEIETKKVMVRIGKIISRLMDRLNKKTVGKREFFLALVLYYLTERKHAFNELGEKLNILDPTVDVSDLVNWLISSQFIEKEDDEYKIKIEALL